MNHAEESANILPPGPTTTEGAVVASVPPIRDDPGVRALEPWAPPATLVGAPPHRSRGKDQTNLVASALLGGVFAAVVFRQIAGRGPPVWTLFLAGAFLTVALGVLSVAAAERALAASAPVLVFLFALFLFAVALARAGALDHLAGWFIGRARRPEELPVVLFLGFGIASAFLVNDALVLIGVPVLIALARRMRVDPKPLLLVLAFSVTIGSALTPFGNPQNLLVSVQSGIGDPVATFLRYLLLPIGLSFAAGAAYLRRAFAGSMAAHPGEFARLRSAAPPLFPNGGWRGRLTRFPVLWVFPGTMIVLVTLDVTAALTAGPVVPVWEIAGAGAIALLLVSPGRGQIVERMNWTVLLLFAGLFVVVDGAVAGGVVSSIEGLLPIPGPAHPTGALLAVIGASILGPQLVSNVPWVALQIPLLANLGYGGSTPLVWVGLAAGSTLAGNLTLLGAASNLIVAELAEKEGIPLRLGLFVRYGLPLAAISLVALTACLVLGL